MKCIFPVLCCYALDIVVEHVEDEAPDALITLSAFSGHHFLQERDKQRRVFISWRFSSLALFLSQPHVWQREDVFSLFTGPGCIQHQFVRDKVVTGIASILPVHSCDVRPVHPGKMGDAFCQHFPDNRCALPDAF